MHFAFFFCRPERFTTVRRLRTSSAVNASCLTHLLAYRVPVTDLLDCNASGIFFLAFTWRLQFERRMCVCLYRVCAIYYGGSAERGTWYAEV